MSSSRHAAEVASGERFEFGKNWARFLTGLTDSRIQAAERSLTEMLGGAPAGKSFLDAGSGSGLFSLAARRLGANVHSFDYDPHSVSCTQELRRRYFSGDANWRVEAGSVLDREYLAGLGTFDVVYSWGVLHHTGQMWSALENVAASVAPNGQLFIAIYNDQGTASRRWTWVKRTYSRSPLLRWPLLWASFWYGNWRSVAKDVLRMRPFHTFRHYEERRGMSLWHDLVDWVGGYPFEVARPEDIFDFYRSRGFTLERLKTTNSLGCNQFVFRRR
jgi:2-polyprenyl-3-methyl-5-hydroxy-6-metoxy-1,4-benzoquinol methylase